MQRQESLVPTTSSTSCVTSAVSRATYSSCRSSLLHRLTYSSSLICLQIPTIQAAGLPSPSSSLTHLQAHLFHSSIMGVYKFPAYLIQTLPTKETSILSSLWHCLVKIASATTPYQPLPLTFSYLRNTYPSLSRCNCTPILTFS